MTERPIECSSGSTAIASFVDFVETHRLRDACLDVGAMLCAELGSALAVTINDATLRRIFDRAHRNDIPARWCDAVLVHLIPYVGLGPVERAFAIATEAHATERLGSLPVLADRAARIAAGLLHYRKFDESRPEQQQRRYAGLSEDYYWGGMELMSLSFADEGLAMREREIATVAALASTGCAPDQLRFHLSVATRYGVSKSELAEVFLVVQIYAGVPRAHNGAALAATLFEAPSEGQTP